MTLHPGTPLEPPPAPLTTRRLCPADARAFKDLRLEGFRLQVREFRYAPEDEAGLGLAEAQARIEANFVVGAFSRESLIGIAGLGRCAGVKVRHKALLWGMYVRAEFRGCGAADMLAAAILAHARESVEAIVLTVVRQNERAVRFYQRWGFEICGVEPASIKLDDGTYLDEAMMVRRL